MIAAPFGLNVLKNPQSTTSAEEDSTLVDRTSFWQVDEVSANHARHRQSLRCLSDRNSPADIDMVAWVGVEPQRFGDDKAQLLGRSARERLSRGTNVVNRKLGER